MRIRWATLPVTIGATLALTAATAFAATIVVDQDGMAGANGCNGTNPVPTDIQSGVNQAQPGDTVKVCGGPAPYAGATVPTDNVALVGVNHPVVSTNSAATAITLNGNNDSITGFTITNSGTGILTDAAHSGYRIQKNDINNNGIGIDLGNSGANQALVSRNTIANNNNPLNPAATGTGIYSDGTLINALITGNRFDGNNNEQINLVPTGTPAPDSGITIFRNTFVHGQGSDIAFCPGCSSSVNNSTISHNNITDSANGMVSSIFISGAQNDTVTGNKITNSNCNGVAVRDPAQNITVTSNTITTPACHGIDVSSTMPGAVNASRNKVTGAGDVGINLGPGTNGNTLTTNRAKNSQVNATNPLGLNCQDLGSGNTWTGNRFAPSNPVTICT